MQTERKMTFVDEKGRVLFSPEGCGEGYTIIQLAESGYIGLLEEIAERFANYEQRLKEYEDIGLKPEQIWEIDKLYAEKCKELAELEKKSFSGIEMVKIWAKLQKLKEYQDLEEQGKLPKLPCAVGDKVYVIPSKANYKLNILSGYSENNRVYEQIVNRIEISEKGYLLVTCDGMESLVDTFYKKTWFLTGKEAEAALKELEGGKGK